MRFILRLSLFYILITFTKAYAQTGNQSINTNGSSSTAISTAVPFLTVSPDARSGALGDAGVAISPDGNDTYWNPSKLVFMDAGNSLSLSYSPWLRHLLPNSNLAYLSYAQKLDTRTAIGFSLRYFNLGTSDLFDGNEIGQGTYQPVEFSIDGSVSRKFGDNFSLGLTLRYIHSSLSNGVLAQGVQTIADQAIAADVSAFDKYPTQQFGTDALFAFGVDISNIGSKVSPSNVNEKYFLPMNLKVGVANTWYLDSYNEVMLTLDLNKLLVPTPPIRDNNGNIIAGKDDNVSVVDGIFSSFTDASGGAKEEFQEISYSTGFEYWYDRQFAIRAGYFYENPNQGGRQYMTLGAGFKLKDLALDFSYLLGSQETSPLANTLRFSLGYSFGHI
jgi:hypothetical protein